jgi:hypothetical protein
VPFLPIFKFAVFDPEATRLMGEGFDLALALLASPPPIVIQEYMASRIITAVRDGERDVKRLRDAALGAPDIAPS